MTDQTTDSSLSSLYHIEHLNNENWLGWKCHVKAILFEKGIEGYVEGTVPRPPPGRDADIAQWEINDQKAQTVIELSVADSQMIHLSGAKVAKEIWDQLKLVKESRGKQVITTWWGKFYRTFTDDDDDIPMHIKHMREIQETLHMMGSLVAEDNFCTVLISSLPESWDIFTTTYQNRIGDANTITSHELISLIMEENSRRKEKLNEKGKEKESALTMKEKSPKKKREHKEIKSVRFARSPATLTRTAGSRISRPNTPTAIKADTLLKCVGAKVVDRWV
jgi:hypothetical protein